MKTDECILDGVGQSLIIFKLDLQVNLAYKILINLSVFHRMKFCCDLDFAESASPDPDRIG